MVTDWDAQITDDTTTTYWYINSPKLIQLDKNCLHEEQLIWNPNWLGVPLVFWSVLFDYMTQLY